MKYATKKFQLFTVGTKEKEGWILPGGMRDSLTEREASALSLGGLGVGWLGLWRKGTPGGRHSTDKGLQVVRGMRDKRSRKRSAIRGCM